MSVAKKLDLIPVVDYLAGELNSPVKHEYLGGVVYAMAGGSNRHNQLATNALISLGSRLRGRSCRAYNSDTKIRLRLSREVRFYYPDVSVVCRSNPDNETFQDEPVVVIEVLSDSTRRVDEGEKKDAFLTIPSLTTYLLAEQDRPAVVAYRKTERGVEREVYQGMDASISLPEIECELQLSEVYEGISFD
jgi:Uma2 family endonuclease